MQIIKYPERKDWPEVLKRPRIETAAIEQVVNDILKDIREKGDAAIRSHTLRIDKIEVSELLVSKAEIEDARKQVPDKLKEAIALAKKNIERFHTQQKHVGKVVETSPGVKCWQKNVAIEKVGLYIPGGTAPLLDVYKRQYQVPARPLHTR